MRDVIFRGKTAKGEWVEGNLIIEEQDNSKVNFMINKDLVVKYFIQEPKGEWGTYRNEIGFIAWKVFYRKELVIPETVGQFTGLTDKNGRKIFEGDIISSITLDTNTEQLAVVGFGKFIDENNDDEYLGFYIEFDGFKTTITQLEMEEVKDRFEVIGNIHDNPEMLEGKE